MEHPDDAGSKYAIYGTLEPSGSKSGCSRRRQQNLTLISWQDSDAGIGARWNRFWKRWRHCLERSSRWLRSAETGPKEKSPRQILRQASEMSRSKDDRMHRLCSTCRHLPSWITSRRTQHRSGSSCWSVTELLRSTSTVWLVWQQLGWCFRASTRTLNCSRLCRDGGNDFLDDRWLCQIW